MDISVVIPLLNEAESLPELAAWIERVMAANQFSYEVIFIDDGSTDKSWQVITDLRAKNPLMKGIRFNRNYGKSAALHVGFGRTSGNVVITMDADLQDSPDEIPDLYKMITVDGYDLVSGYKAKRYDPITKTIPTKLFNWATRKVSGIPNLHDFNCGLKAYRKEVVKSIEVYGEMHRYIPVIAKAAGFSKIQEKVVAHQARKYGKSKFGWNRFINGFLDLLSITVLSKYLKRPMHFFGFWGLLWTLLGGGFMVYLFVYKMGAVLNLGFGGPLSERMPALLFSSVCFLLGVILISTGLLSELIVRNAPGRNDYLIGSLAGFDDEKPKS